MFGRSEAHASGVTTRRHNRSSRDRANFARKQRLVALRDTDPSHGSNAGRAFTNSQPTSDILLSPCRHRRAQASKLRWQLAALPSCAFDLRREHLEEEPILPTRPRASNPLSVKTTSRRPQDACDYSRGLAHHCASQRTKISGQKSRSSHTHSPATPKLRLSERQAWFRRASAARYTRSLAAGAHVSTRDAFDWSLLLVNPSRVPAASKNPSSIEELANLVEPRGEAFHDALILLWFGGRGRNRCERYLLEPTHPHQASDTPVASVTVNRGLVE